MKVYNLMVGVSVGGIAAWLGYLSWTVHVTKKDAESLHLRVMQLEKGPNGEAIQRESNELTSIARSIGASGTSRTKPASKPDTLTETSSLLTDEPRLPIATNDLERNFITGGAYEAAKRCLVEWAPEADQVNVLFKVRRNGAVADVLTGPMDNANLRSCVESAVRQLKTTGGPSFGNVIVFGDRRPAKSSPP